MHAIRYRSGYKYQLAENYSIQTDIIFKNVLTEYIDIVDGLMTIKRGYAWDGPSGPTFDTPSFMRGSLVHDALYQAMGEGYLSWEWQGYADELLVKLCKEDGMPAWRRAYVWWAVDRFGKKYSMKNKNSVLTAP